jgi:group I intron endonuclease
MTNCGIYQILNVMNGRRYLGSSQDCQRRKSEHMSRLRRGAHGNAKLQAAWNKHGEAAFQFSMVFSVFNRDDLESIEQAFLDEDKAVEIGYNLAPTAGNTAGWRASDETRRRMSDAAKRRDNTAQQLAMVAAVRGKKRTKEFSEHLSARRKGAKATEETKVKQAASARARSRYTEIHRLQMAILKLEGHSLRAIGGIFGLPHQNVHKYIASLEL